MELRSWNLAQMRGVYANSRLKRFGGDLQGEELFKYLELLKILLVLWCLASPHTLRAFILCV
jgi:hypothetical protein